MQDYTDFQRLVSIDKGAIEYSLNILTTKEAKQNYLYFIRDEINKLIKATK